MGSSASASGPHHRLPCRHLQVTFQIHGLRQLSEHAQRLNLWKNNLGLLRNLLQHSGNPSWFLLNASKDTRSALDPSEKPTKSPSLREEVSCPNSQKSSTQPPRCQTPRTENKKILLIIPLPLLKRVGLMFKRHKKKETCSSPQRNMHTHETSAKSPAECTSSPANLRRCTSNRIARRGNTKRQGGGHEWLLRRSFSEALAKHARPRFLCEKGETKPNHTEKHCARLRSSPGTWRGVCTCLYKVEGPCGECSVGLCPSSNRLHC